MDTYDTILVDLSPFPLLWVILTAVSTLLVIASALVVHAFRRVKGRSGRRGRLLGYLGLVVFVLFGAYSATTWVGDLDPGARDRQENVLAAVEDAWDVEVLLPAALPSTPIESEYRVPANVGPDRTPELCTLAAYETDVDNTVEIGLWCNGYPAPINE